MQVAGRAADDEREADARDQLMWREAARRRTPTPTSAAVAITAMSDGLERKVGGVQDAERRAGVPHVREVEEARDDRSRCRAAAASRRTMRLRDLIEHDDEQSAARFRGGAAVAAAACMASVSGSCRSVSRQRVLAAIAEPGPGRLGRDRRHIAPAALALHAAGALDRDRGARSAAASAAPAAARPPTR